MHSEVTACEVLFVFCFFIEIEAFLYQGEVPVRLVGGPTQYEGRLEVYKSGKWGTVCDDVLNNNLSVVVCRSLGLPWKTSVVSGNAAFGEGSGPIWLDDINCSGSETSIKECKHKGWGSHNCDHSEDVSINCLPPDGSVRLIGGPTQSEGRLEVYKSGRWGTVCDDGLNNKLSVVVCRSLGLPWKTSEAYGNAVYGEGSGPIWLDSVNCSASETSIKECKHKGWGSHNCDHSKDVSINCLPSNVSAVRLVGGPTQSEGRLEVYKFGRWGTVCGGRVFNQKLSVVVCRSLGLPWKTSEAYVNAVYGEGSGPIWLDNIKCSGSETSIKECKHKGWGSHSCGHRGDISINCSPSNVSAVRLVGGPTQSEGRLEVYKFGRWGTVCDRRLKNKLSVVVCRSLGLPWKISVAFGNAVYGEGSGPVWLIDVNCSGSETSINECKHKGWASYDCGHWHDVSINCSPSNEGSVRLVGGPTQYDGRLEVYKFGRWGTVCDDNLNNNVSVVVCRSLGLPWEISVAYGNAVYGEGSGPIWLNNVNCFGSETSINECKHKGWGSHDCGHSEDVSINCSPSNEVPVRLVGGPTQYEGRLEVYNFGRWGTVCDDDLNNNLSVVVCRSLGLPWKFTVAYGNAAYGRGSGPIWLDDVNCSGSETSIKECNHIGWGSHNCDHSEDVSINCLPSNVFAVRLVGGPTQSEGRLEVYKLGRWGTVCDNGLNNNISVVVCRSLGLPWNTSEAYGNAVYGQGSGPIWLDNVKCSGSETSIKECKHKGWGPHNCYHNKDVSINCLPPNEVPVRLVGGPTQSEGRLEVYKLGRWGTVCDNGLNNNISVVVCRSLGLPWNTSETYRSAVYGQGSGPIWLDIVNCSGSETSIKECKHKVWRSHNCNHSNDVSINCLPSNVSAVRLVGGPTQSEGRLEVYKFGRWGTVCDDGLNNNLSVVVCRSLGLPWNTSEAYGNAVYGRGSGPIWLKNVKCSGSETSIKECKHKGWGEHYCGHSKDVSISCLPSNVSAVRLVGGPTQSEGRLEVYKFGRWGTVCDNGLNNNISVGVCRSLGLPWNTSEAYGNAVYGRWSGPIWLDDVNCSGSENSINECKHNGWGSHNCYNGRYVSINCLPSNVFAVRLVGGLNQSEGRLEVYKFGRWGTVCDDGLNNKLSVVVCRSLGLPWNTSEAYANAAYGRGSGPIWLDDVNCSGSETSIRECKHRGWESHNCVHSEDVSINCLPSNLASNSLRQQFIVNTWLISTLRAMVLLLLYKN